MYVSFRQGLVKHQVDSHSNPAFLQRVSGGQYVSLIVSPTPTVLCIAYTDTDYLYEETRTVDNAWGPFSGAVDRWLYWDIDMGTGARTFGHTSREPIFSNTAPSSPPIDQHWFDKTNMVMKVWNGVRWEEKIRIFAAKYSNSAVLISYPPGSQVGVNTPCQAGFILFDDDEKPVKKWKRDNKGKFLTTETPIITHASRVSNVVLDGVTRLCRAHENIPQWSVVAFDDYDRVILASYLDQTRPAAGIAKWNMNTGDQGIIHTSGYITNNNWNWSEPASTSLYVGNSGQITTVVPQIGSIQRIGMVVDTDTIFVDIGMHIILDES